MSDTDCIFCKIASGEIKADLVYQDDQVAAFRDLKPQAPVHILIVPKQHISSLAGVSAEHEAVLGRVMVAASRLAEREGIARDGFRVVMNAGANAGQTVDHVHLHLLGGRGMGWPPG
jgi:histidine triad (HIT) family protein